MKRSGALFAMALAAALLTALSVALLANPEGPNHFRFAILGDRTGEAQTGVYESVWSDVDRERPAFAINVGDTIQGGADATAEAEWREARAIWGRYNYRLFFTPGNHDIWSDASQKLYEKYTGRPAFYSFDFENAHFTVLDNSRTENLSAEQMRFLERDLERNRERRPKFVFFHRPEVWLIPLKFQSGEFPLHQLARKYGVTAVVSGHTHQFAFLERDGVMYLCVESSGGHLRAADNGAAFARGWFYGHVLATVSGAAVEFVAEEIGGEKGRGRTFHFPPLP